MKYEVKKNKIIIKETEDFCPEHILECGQIFSYKKQGEDYVVYSQDKMAIVKKADGEYVIETNTPNYFVRFFDLNTNYHEIKKQLIAQNEFLKNAVEFGHGIRISNQDYFETIISFIVSANNNIKRIQKILFAIREKYGKNMGSYHAFPTLNELKNATIEDFKTLGAGYRAQYLYKAIRQLESEDYISWKNLTTKELNQKLISLMGVGQKVADCIMLFAYEKKDVFPVDTWIHQVYNKYYQKEDNRLKIRKELVKAFGNFSGYAQQYFFYMQRSGKQL